MRSLPSKAAATLSCLVMFAVALLVFSASALAQAQATAADLSGTVTDPSGAVVAGATVTAKNIGTNAARTVVSGPDGDYQFIGLPPGEYESRVQALMRGGGAAQAGATRPLMLRAGETLFLIERVML